MTCDSTQRRYFYAKVGKSNSLFKQFMEASTPAIPIFFEMTNGNRTDFEAAKEGKEQGRNFFWCSDNQKESIIVVIHKGIIHLYSPSGAVKFLQVNDSLAYADKGQFIKLLPVELIDKYKVADVPAIISTMTANAYYYTGTFREVSDIGNVRAIQYLLNEKQVPINSSYELLSCLSSIEIETLIAKVFEELGCFVPAYRGGAMKDIDIIAKNNNKTPISVTNIVIQPAQSISVQVKRSTKLTEPPKGCDHLISIDRDGERLLELIITLDKTYSWLKESLYWLPEQSFNIMSK